MCDSDVQQPDTSAQQAQLDYQLQVQKQLAAQQQAQDAAQAQAQLDAANKTATDQAAAQKAEYDRQYALQQQELASQQQQAQDAAAKQAAQEAAVEQTAKDRAAAQTTYATGRQSLIDQFTGAVNDAYSGFNDDYYNNYEKSIQDASTPQLNDDYDQSSRALTLAFANRGNLNGTAAARQFGVLAKDKATSEADIANQSIDAANELKSANDAQRTSALSSLFTSTNIGNENLPDGVTDASGALSDLTGQVTGLRDAATKAASSITAPSTTSLGGILSKYTGNVQTPSGSTSQFTRNGGYASASPLTSGQTSYMVS